MQATAKRQRLEQRTPTSNDAYQFTMKHKGHEWNSEMFSWMLNNIYRLK